MIEQIRARALSPLNRNRLPDLSRAVMAWNLCGDIDIIHRSDSTFGWEMTYGACNDDWHRATDAMRVMMMLERLEGSDVKASDFHHALENFGLN